MTNDHFIWVAPQPSGTEKGTAENPYGDISRALAAAQPGDTVLLKPGRYSGDLTVEQSGTARLPITIRAQSPGTVEVAAGCWYFYDAGDFIVSDITFRDAPCGAVAFIGACSRNCLARLSFINCGDLRKASGTVFFGGSGSRCNVVEDCSFLREDAAAGRQISAGSAIVGVMITEGDADGESPKNTNLVVRRNRFERYDYAIIAGSADRSAGAYGHVMEYNTTDRCTADGILVKCGDTTVRGNVFSNISGNAVCIAAGSASTVTDNRAVDCGRGIRICGDDHTVSNNCLVRMAHRFIDVEHLPPQDGAAVGSAVIIENNTMICSGGLKGAQPGPFITVGAGSACVIQNNLFHGPGKPYQWSGGKNGLPDNGCFAGGNGVSGGAETIAGCCESGVVFDRAASDGYANSSGFGARGWVLNPEAYDPDTAPRNDDAEPLEGPEDDDEIVIPGAEDDGESAPLSAHSLFFGEPSLAVNDDGDDE